MNGIFISYRREDVGGHAGRLCDRLNARLGGDRVFMDVEDIRPGQDFVRTIDDTVGHCEYVLVVIGPRWLEMMERRATADNDFVRQEILAGLRRRTTVIPVLMGGARMPDARELPPDLTELSRLNAIEIRDDRFDDDVTRLVGFLGGQSQPAAPARFPRRWLLAGAVAVAGIVLAGLAFQAREPAAPPLDGTWVADMQKPGQRPFRIQLTFVRAGAALRGVVSYPTGDGVIQEGTVDGDALTFSTSHVPQFESSPAVIRFVGRLGEDGIQLTSTDDAGIATGVARRRTSP